MISKAGALCRSETSGLRSVTAVPQECALCITERLAELPSFLEGLASRIRGRFRPGGPAGAKGGGEFVQIGGSFGGLWTAVVGNGLKFRLKSLQLLDGDGIPAVFHLLELGLPFLQLALLGLVDTGE